MNIIKGKIKDLLNMFVEWLNKDSRHKWMICIAVLVMFIFLLSGSEEEKSHIFIGEDYKSISKNRTVNNPYKNLAIDKINIIGKAEKNIRKENRVILSEVEKMKESLSELSEKIDRMKGSVKIKQAEDKSSDVNKEERGKVVNSDVENGPSRPEVFETKKIDENISDIPKRNSKLGPYSVVFPIGVKGKDEKNGVIIGKGSRVLGSVISGAEVPMGETYPVLIQLDYAFIMANNKRVNLQGCVLIAKSETVFATGKMKMQPESVTCYGPSGNLYSKSKIKGWFSDPKDDNFGMRAELKTNAAKKSFGVFGQSFVKGLGEAIKRGAKSVGGQGIETRPDVIIQDSGQRAGEKVGELFIEYLDGLKPTLKINSGRKTWLILGSDLVIPYKFFEQRSEYEKKHSSGVTDFVQ